MVFPFARNRPVELACFFALAYQVSGCVDDAQAGWRCFDVPKDPIADQQQFIDCIVDRTRRDMIRNPQLYDELSTLPDALPIEFFDAKQDEGGERWVTYRFRYPTKSGQGCFYHVADPLGGYYVRGPTHCY